MPTNDHHTYTILLSISFQNHMEYCGPRIVHFGTVMVEQENGTVATKLKAYNCLKCLYVNVCML